MRLPSLTRNLINNSDMYRHITGHIAKTLSAALMIALAACSEDENVSRIPASAVYDIVTLESTGDKGTTFTMQVNGDSPEITYTAPYDFSNSTQLKEGMRIMICYSRGDDPVYTSGIIDLYGYSLMSNTEPASLTGTAAEYRNWESQPVKIRAMWRTGKYINMQAELYTLRAVKPERFVIVADEATLSSPYPELHVIFDNEEGNDGENLQPVNASFDISNVWLAPTAKGVTVFFPTPTGESSQVFEKPISADDISVEEPQ